MSAVRVRFHAPHQGIDRRGARRRRRSRHEPAPAHDHRRREGGRTCRPTTSSARSAAAPARSRASRTKKRSTKAYGPGGAAVIIDVLTDNKNRTVGELRHMLEKHGGNLAATNAVAWMFAKKGYIVVEKSEGRRREADGRGARRRRRRPAGRRRQLGSAVSAPEAFHGRARRGEGARHRAGQRRRSR